MTSSMSELSRQSQVANKMRIWDGVQYKNKKEKKEKKENIKSKGYLLASSFAYPNHKQPKSVAQPPILNGFLKKKKKEKNFTNSSKKSLSRQQGKGKVSAVYKGTPFDLFNLQRRLLMKNYQNQKIVIRRDNFEIDESDVINQKGGVNNSNSGDIYKSVALNTLTTNQSINY